MEKFKKIRNIAAIGIGLGFIVLIVYKFYELKRLNSQNPATVLSTAPADYFNLFVDSAKKRLTTDITYMFKSGKVITRFSYDRNFAIEVAKIDTDSDLSLTKILFDTHNQADETIDGFYFPFTQNNLTVNYNIKPSQEPKKIYVSLSEGQSKPIEQNDSTVCYFLNANKFWIRYEQNGPVEIYGTEKKDTYMNIMFLKRNNSLYFIALSSADSKILVNTGLLAKLVGNFTE